jgi:hypothetical protein
VGEVGGLVLLVNGRVQTNDPRRPRADAIALRGGSVVLVGSSAEVRKLSESGAVVIDLHGARVRAAADGGILRRGEVVQVVIENAQMSVEARVLHETDSEFVVYRAT